MPTVNSIANKFAKKLISILKEAQKSYPMVAGKYQVSTPAEADALRQNYGPNVPVAIVPKKPAAPAMSLEESREAGARRKQEYLDQFKNKQQQSGAGYVGYKSTPSEVAPTPKKKVYIPPKTKSRIIDVQDANGKIYSILRSKWDSSSNALRSKYKIVGERN